MKLSTLNLAIGGICGLVIGIIGWICFRPTSDNVQFIPIVIQFKDLKALHVLDSNTGENKYLRLHFSFIMDNSSSPATITLIPTLQSSTAKEILPNTPLHPIRISPINNINLDASKFDLQVEDDNSTDTPPPLVNRQVKELLRLKDTYTTIEAYKLVPNVDQQDHFLYYEIIPRAANDGDVPGFDPAQYTRLLRLDPIPPGVKY